MKFVTITVNGESKTMVQSSDGTWAVTNSAPSMPGVYPVELTLTTDNGNDIKITSDDYNLANSLLLIVNGGDTVYGKQMLNYYPDIIKVITEFKELMRTEGFEIDLLHREFNRRYDDAYLHSMGEERVSEWEKQLGIKVLSTDTLEQRRDDVIAKFAGSSKLNTATIQNIVKTYTNGEAVSKFENGVLTVEIKPPAHNKDFKFSAVENELRKRIPAHIGLNVIRDYATWGDITTNFKSWNTVASMDDWSHLAAYVAP